MTYKPLIPEEDFKNPYFKEEIFEIPVVDLFAEENENKQLDFQTPEHLPERKVNTNNCFDSNNLPKTSTLSELLDDLCELMIRFDGPVSTYRKGDYEHLIKTLTNSTIQLYTEGVVGVDSSNAAHFIGVADLNTDPHNVKINRGHKFPGVYLLDKVGLYPFFNLDISEDLLNNSIIFAIPAITNNSFVGYNIANYNLEVSLSKYAMSGGSNKTIKDLENIINSLVTNIPPPEYLKPEISLNLTNSILESGSPNDRTIRITYNQRDGGEIISQKIFRNNIQVSATSTYIESGSVKDGLTKYRAEVVYEQGPIKENDVGVLDEVGRIEAGVVSTERTITGILPYY